MITPGLRWEFNPSPAAGAVHILPGSRRPAPSSIATTACCGRCPTRNFAPRLGAAWRVRKSGRTVLRAGGGLFYDSSLSIATDLINSGPFNITQFTNGIHGLVLVAVELRLSRPICDCRG